MSERESLLPAPGQVWESRDPRDEGRTVLVERVGAFVYVKGNRRSTIRLDNFRRLYRFVR